MAMAPRIALLLALAGLVACAPSPLPSVRQGSPEPPPPVEVAAHVSQPPPDKAALAPRVVGPSTPTASKLVVKTDNVDKLRWYSLPHVSGDFPGARTPKGWSGEGFTRVEFYIVESLSGGPLRLRMQMMYGGTQRAFFLNTYTLVIDGRRIDAQGQFRRDYGESVYELRDVDMPLELAEEIMNSKESVLRLRGSNGLADHTFTQEHRQLIGEIVAAYKEMGGS